MDRTQLMAYLKDLLDPNVMPDYCPNGLQVEGTETVHRVIGGVTASQALIKLAIEREADALLVHHGYFWKGEPAPIIGMKHKRIRALIQHNINLIAYHLPLDLHVELGNNKGLADCLGIQDDQPNTANLLRFGAVAKTSIGAFINHVEHRLNRTPLHLAGGPEPIQRIAWCSGGAQDMIEEAAINGADLFISGEVSERTTHLAKELGIHYLACGHHATETFGVERLGRHLATQFGIQFEFINLDNPV